MANEINISKRPLYNRVIRWRYNPPAHYPIPPSILPKAALSAWPLIRFPFITIKSLNLIQFITIRSLKWNTVFHRRRRLVEEETRIVHLSSLLVNPLCSRKRGAFWPKPTFDAMQALMQPSLKFKATFLRPSQVSQLTEGRGTWLDQTSLLQRAL